MKYLVLLSVFIISCKSSVGKITRIVDGDTYIFNYNERVRLYDVDCPELSQPYGKEAQNFATDLLLDKEVFLDRKGKDKYGRTLADIRFKKYASTVNLCMLSRGFAFVSRRYCHNQRLIKEFEYAKQYKQGMFSNSNWESPYNYRRHKKLKQ